MAFTEEVKVAISSMFDNSGVKNARKSMGRLQNMSKKTGLSAESLQRRMQGMGMAFNQQGKIINNSTGNVMKHSNAMTALTNGYGALAETSQITGSSIGGMNEQLQASDVQIRRNAQGAAMFQNKYTGSMMNAKQATGEMRRATNRFRMDQLSLMFGFMALRRVMSGMLKPAFKSVGVFDTISTIMELVFLPIAIEVQEVMLGFLDFFAELPRSVKLFIGALTLLGIALTTVGLVMAQVSLITSAIWGVTIGEMVGAALMGSTSITSIFTTMATSVASIFSGLAASVGSIAGTIAGVLTAPVIAGVAILVGAVLLLNEAWANNFGGIKGITADVIDFIGNSIDWLIEKLNMLPGVNIKVKDAFDGMADSIRDSADAGKGKGFLGFSLTGKGGLLEGGIGNASGKIMDSVGGLFSPDISTPNTGKFGRSGGNGSKFIQNNVRQDVQVQRGSGNDSDFAFSRKAGRELQKGTENALSRTQGTN